MTTTPHPFRKSNVAIYERVKGENGPKFIGYIEPIGKFPVRFSGSTAMETMQQARRFIDTEATKLEEKEAQRAEREAQRKPKKAEEA